ncbi:BrnT family toxin [Rhodopseudomonas palustris]|uniref:BrnT family toxin n=1 Tax=Rhodopseudomonas palustris TaxID=1076 RepID=UPI0021F2E71E|nr:BrnT family toxin [Rhodopseudomonas palustris]UYO55111.1 BrnT family toxin [Rhodopseudomonas palustris]
MELQLISEHDSDGPFAGASGFDWDKTKSDANLAKHGLDFDEAKEIFYGQVLLRRSDRKNEERWIAIGVTSGRIVTVIFTRRGDNIRIISARHPRADEEREYRHTQMGRPEQGQD